jgi:hypothetical protein
MIRTSIFPVGGHARADRVARTRRCAAAAFFLLLTTAGLRTGCCASEIGPGPGSCRPAPVNGPAGDTVRIDETEITWTKEELKNVLTEQSGIMPEGTAQKSKNARVAMLCTLLFPGLGQMYNERPFKAIIAMGVETFYVSQILLNHRNSRRAERRRDRLPYGSSEWKRQDWWIDEYKERRLDWIWWSSGVLVVLMLDSYIDAHLYDMNVRVEGMALEGGAGIRLVYMF